MNIGIIESQVEGMHVQHHPGRTDMILNLLFRLLLTFNATSLLVIIYLVHKKYTLGYFFQGVPELQFQGDYADYISYALYLMVPLVLTGGVSCSVSFWVGMSSKAVKWPVLNMLITVFFRAI